MLRSFFIITLRILWRNKVTSFINIASLAIGMTAFILIMLYVHHEMSYDKFNKNYDRIYRLEGDDYEKLPPVIGDNLINKIPEIENIARLSHDWELNLKYKPSDNPEKEKEIVAHGFFADSTTFDVFTLPFIQGDPESALKAAYTVVLTERIANNLFGESNPMGKTVELNNNQFTVTGVIKNVKKSHIDLEVLFSRESIAKMYPTRDLNDAGSNSWLWTGTYILMTNNANPQPVEKKIDKVLNDFKNADLINLKFKNFHLRPLKEIYFRGTKANLQYGKHGNLKLVRTFGVIAIFILTLACINYINLTTARATLRTKEVAMKKVVGSGKALLRYQFIIESILVTMISFLIAFTLVQGLLPKFNQLVLVNISMDEFKTPMIWILSIFGVLSIGIISGLYPALYLTNIRFSSLIKGGTLKGSGGTTLRRILLTFQFSISILLIIGIITNLRQLHYGRTMDLGFNKDYVITVGTSGDDGSYAHLETPVSRRETLKERLLKNPAILKVSFTCNSLGGQLPISGSLEIEGENRSCNWLPVDPDYLDVMGIELVKGRNFSWDIEGDCMWDLKGHKRKDDNIIRLIFNETAANRFWTESPLGKIHTAKLQGLGNFRYEVVGIVKDFHYRSVHHQIEPVFFIWNWLQHLMCIKISSSDIPTTLQYIESEWRNVYGTTPFNYSFLDETFNLQYKSDEKVAEIIGYFTLLAIIIACMGLFALSSFMAARRTKEIGIRKAMGASTGRIFLLLSLEYIKWIMISMVIASPVALVMMNKWLQTFAYHINLGADIFIMAALMALVIALLTVTWQSLKSALANPVKALRYE